MVKSNLFKLLFSMTSTDAIDFALNIENSGLEEDASSFCEKSDSFYETMGYMGRARIFEYACYQNGLSILTDPNNLSEDQTRMILKYLESAVSAGLNYCTIRKWWVVAGTSIRQAEARKQEDLRKLASYRYSVLVFRTEGRPMFLNINKQGDVSLVEDKVDAYKFPFGTLQDVTPDRALSLFNESKGLISLLKSKFNAESFKALLVTADS